MNSKLLIQKTVSLCLAVAIFATYSMTTLASSERIVGELSVSGKAVNGENLFVRVNGEEAQAGRSIFSSSTITTPENTSATVNLGKTGAIELAPNTTLTLSFNENSISGDLSTGRITVLNASNKVNIKMFDGTVSELGVGDSATAGKAQDDDDDTTGGGGRGTVIAWALVLGGAAAGIIFAATTDNNRIALSGGNSNVVSPTR